MNTAVVGFFLFVLGIFALPFLRKTTYSLVLVLTIFILALLQFILIVSFDQGDLFSELAFRPEDVGTIRSYTIVTHMFLHGGFLHLMGNTLFLVFFGFPLESRIGCRRFAAIYILSGVGASLFVTAFSYAGFPGAPAPGTPSIGASGAIFGVMGAYLALYPKDQVMMPLFFMLMRAPVWVGVFLYGGFETFLAMSGMSDGIGHLAHVGGLVTGLVIAPLVKVEVQRTLNTVSMEVLATTPETVALLKKIEAEDIPEIRQVWVEQLIREARCPRCGGRLLLRGRSVRSQCGWTASLK